MASKVAAFVSTAMRMLLPPACVACHRAMPIPPPVSPTAVDQLCHECRAFLRFINQTTLCRRCGTEHPQLDESGIPAGYCSECARLPRSFTAARSAFPYDSPAGMIVRNMKYQKAPYLAPILAELSLPVLAGWVRTLGPGVHVLAMPMNGWREVARGYNQADLLARAMAPALELPLIGTGALVRARKAKPQARYHTRPERMRNLEGVFEVRDAAAIAGRRVLLIDDVMTTGATAAMAASELVKAGAAEVFIATAVRAKLRQDNPLLDPLELPEFHDSAGDSGPAGLAGERGTKPGADSSSSSPRTT